MRYFSLLIVMMVWGCADPGGSGDALPPGPARVVDGDSLEMAGHRVRLEGIDAPEWDQVCRRPDGSDWAAGAAASAWVRARVAGRVVTCDVVGRDRYGRLLAHCAVAGQDINGGLVRAGLALAYERYSTRYVPQQDAARAARRGLWGATCDTPEAWRRAHPWKPKGAEKGG